MHAIYIYRYIYYILANLTTLEHILNLQRGIQLWLVFLSLQIDQSHAFDFTDFTDSRSRHTQKLTRFLPSNVLISVWSVLLMSYRFSVPGKTAERTVCGCKRLQEQVPARLLALNWWGKTFSTQRCWKLVTGCKFDQILSPRRWMWWLPKSYWIFLALAI